MARKASSKPADSTATIGKTVDDAMVAIERDNPRLKGVLPKDYARPGPYTALRGSAFLQSEASPQVMSAAKDNGRIYDPACGSGGMFVQSEKFVESHGGNRRLCLENAVNFSLN